jgi:hypothetical protein
VAVTGLAFDAERVALLVCRPGVLAVTVMVIVNGPLFAASAPRFQVRTLPTTVLGAGTALTYVTPAGSVSTSVTPAAAESEMFE